MFTHQVQSGPIRFIDLFCGIGGFRIGCEQGLASRGTAAKCVFSSDIDQFAQDAYEANFGERPSGDITKVEAETIPDHELLLAGFPCQPFSIMGVSKGFSDTRGTLFFDIARILEAKQPEAFVLENVKRLTTHDGGRTFSRILETAVGLGYDVTYRVLNALDFGLPQKRERIFIVGTRRNAPFFWPLSPMPRASLADILEKDPDPELFASNYIRARRRDQATAVCQPGIWHENKSGHVSVLPYSCALRAGASHNYLLVNGERRMTAREMLRLQGFPDSYKIVCTYGQTRKQAGNSIPVPAVKAVIARLADALEWSDLPAAPPSGSQPPLPLAEAF